MAFEPNYGLGMMRGFFGAVGAKLATQAIPFAQKLHNYPIGLDLPSLLWPRPQRSPWIPYPPRMRMTHRYSSIGSINLTAGQATTNEKFRADNVMDVEVSTADTTSDPAVGATEMAKIYTHYCVRRSKIKVVVLKQTQASVVPIYGRIRLMDMRQYPNITPAPAPPLLPEAEWLQQVQVKPWTPLAYDMATAPALPYGTILTSRFTAKKVKQWKRKPDDLVEWAEPKGVVHDFYGKVEPPLHYQGDGSADTIHVNDRFVYWIEFSTTSAFDPAAFSYQVFIEYLVDWFDPKTVNDATFPAEVPLTVTANAEPGDTHEELAVDTNAASTDLWSSHTDIDPATTP